MTFALTLTGVYNLERSTALRNKLEDTTRYFRKAVTDAGFDILRRTLDRTDHAV